MSFIGLITYIPQIEKNGIYVTIVITNYGKAEQRVKKRDYNT